MTARSKILESRLTISVWRVAVFSIVMAVVGRSLTFPAVAAPPPTFTKSN